MIEEFFVSLVSSAVTSLLIAVVVIRFIAKQISREFRGTASHSLLQQMGFTGFKIKDLKDLDEAAFSKLLRLIQTIKAPAKASVFDQLAQWQAAKSGLTNPQALTTPPPDFQVNPRE